MILTIYITIISLALILLFVGQYLSAPPVQIGSYTILFLLGLTLMLGGVTYKSGENIIYNYNNESLLMNQTLTDTYTDYSGEIILGITLNHIYGLIICLLSALGFIIVFMNIKDGLGGYKQ